MENRDKNTDKRILLGGILIVIGALILIGSIKDFPVKLFSMPSIITVMGIFILLNTNKKLLGGVLTGIGLVFLAQEIIFFYHLYSEEYKLGLIPVLLIAFGTYIILNHRNKDIQVPESSGFLKKDLIDDVSIFGGGSKIVASDNFRGGNITAVFGGSEINLTGCKLADGDQIIDLLLVFGGTTIVVPRDWNVVVNVTSILGGFSDKSIRDPGVIPDQSRTLHVKGLAMFGGGEVKNYI